MTLMSGRKMIMSFVMRQPFLQIGSFLLDEGEVSLQPKSLVDPTFVAKGWLLSQMHPSSLYDGPCNDLKVNVEFLLFDDGVLKSYKWSQIRFLLYFGYTCTKVESNTTQNVVMANPVMIPNGQFKTTLGKISQWKIIPTQSRFPSWGRCSAANWSFLLHILCFLRK